MTDALALPPPTPKLLDYPVLFTLLFAVLFTTVLVAVASRFDPTLGTLTISLLVVVSFIATVVFCLFFTVPTDEITSAVLGGLTASFGAVIAYWLGRPREPPK
jgi:uncharacterized BrkB/YihY/UPF0761 family membrane protein